VPLVSRFLAFASVLLFWAPVVGFVLALSAVIANRKNSGWLKTTSWIGLILSLLVLILFGVALAMKEG